jgi:hypothetical protein
LSVVVVEEIIFSMVPLNPFGRRQKHIQAFSPKEQA